MARKVTTFKFSKEDLLLFDLVQKHGLLTTRAETLRHALRFYVEKNGLMDQARKAAQRGKRVAT